MLLISQLGTLLSWCVFLGALFLPERTFLDVDSALLGAFAVTLPLLILFIARALDGLTGGNVSVANAYLVDVTDEADRKTNFGDKLDLLLSRRFVQRLAGHCRLTALP